MAVGAATVEVGADLRKLLEGLNKAKAASSVFVDQAAKQFVGLGTAAAAAGVGVAGVAGKLALSNTQLKALGENTKSVTAGLTAMLGVLSKVAIAALSFTARHPVLGTALSTVLLGGSPALAAATLAVGTERGRSMLGGLGRGAALVARNPLTALGVGGLGLAAIGAAAKAGSEGFEALKEAFDEARKASASLKEELEVLKTSAEKYTTEMPAGDKLTEATLRRLGGITGGMTSPLAQLLAGKVESDDLEDASNAVEELTLRFRNQEVAAQTLRIALAEPAKGYRLLRDAGFEFSREQIRMIENSRTMEERLEAAGEILSILNAQAKIAKQSGFIQFMSEVGTFLGKTPGAVSESITNTIKGIGAGIVQLTGLDYVIKKVDDAFRSLGEAMEATNKRFFPANAREELEAVRGELSEVTGLLDKLNSSAGRGAAGGGSIIDRILGRDPAAVATARNLLAGQEADTLRRTVELEMQEAERLGRERLARETALDNKLRDRLKDLQEEGRLLQANNRAALEARRIALAEGVEPDDPRIKALERQIRLNQERTRAIAQAGQLSVFERENAQLTQQVQLFRFGNEEMEKRARLLQIELQAAQRRQPINEAQKQALLEQMSLLKEIQNLTGVVNDAFTAVFSSMGDALAQFATTGKFNMKEFADSIVQQLIRIALQAFVLKPLLNAISGFTNPLIAGAVAPGSTSSAISIGKAGSFADGGSFSVPGGGGGDKPYLIGLSAGERVDVTPAGRSRGDGGGVTVINNVSSSKDFEITTQERKTPDGRTIIEQTFSEVMRRIGRGDGDGTFGARYGMRPRTLQR